MSKTETKIATKTTPTLKRKGLGRGLDALLGGSAKFEGAPEEKVMMLALDRLQPGKYQPRTHIDENSLQELAASIRAQGLMQPILARVVEDNEGERYEIIAGERRFRAARLAGLTEVPVLLKEANDQATAAMALIENIQREDLNPLEEAQGIQRLIDEFSFTHEAAAEAVGRSRSAVSNLLRLLNLTQPVRAMLLAGDIDMGHARALLAVDAARQIALAHQITHKHLSVRDAEKLVAASIESEDTAIAQRQTRVANRDMVRLEEDLSDMLAANVKIKLGRKGNGTLTIAFGSRDALEGLIEQLRSTCAEGV